MATSSKPSLPTASIAAVALLLIAGATAAGASQMDLYDDNGNHIPVHDCLCHNHTGEGSYTFTFGYEPAIVYDQANCHGYARVINHEVDDLTPATFRSVQIFCHTDHSRMLLFNGEGCTGNVTDVDDTDCHKTNGAKTYMITYGNSGYTHVYNDNDCYGHAGFPTPYPFTCTAADFKSVQISYGLIRKVAAAL